MLMGGWESIPDSIRDYCYPEAKQYILDRAKDEAAEVLKPKTKDLPNNTFTWTGKCCETCKCLNHYNMFTSAWYCTHEIINNRMGPDPYFVDAQRECRGRYYEQHEYYAKNEGGKA